MAKINLNEMAKKIAEAEGKKQQVSIAQIKEILKITLTILGDNWETGNELEIIKIFKKYSTLS